MGLFGRMKEPVFLKESSNAQAQLEKLKILELQLNKEGQDIIRQDIKNLEYGIVGEKNIAFELKNSHMPMYILHDIYLEDGDLSAQIDYLVFTKKMCFVIECKNLYGNIEINNRGDFIRTSEFNGRKKKEGIYSPITQNQRHLELMKKVKVDSRSGLISRFMTGKYFEEFYRTIVVLANPKTIIKSRYAKKEVKSQVIRADQLVKHIKDVYYSSKNSVTSDASMLEWAQSFLDLHKEVEKDYTEKYEQYKTNTIKPESSENITSVSSVALEEADLFNELKAYRLNKSREEKIKPYFICNNNQLKDLISKMPRSKEELMSVSGFGKVKVEKYGDDILKIVEKY